MHDAGPLQAEDQVHLLAAPRQAPLLDAVRARPASVTDPEVHGDFALEPAFTVAEIEREHGVSCRVSPERTVGDLLMREFQNQRSRGTG